MPLMTQHLDRQGKPMQNGWGWEDRMIFCHFVLLDGGQIGEVKDLSFESWLEMGYVGAGCDHTFTQPFSYSQVNPVTMEKVRTIHIRPGQRYKEWRGY